MKRWHLNTAFVLVGCLALTSPESTGRATQNHHASLVRCLAGHSMALVVNHDIRHIDGTRHRGTGDLDYLAEVSGTFESLGLTPRMASRLSGPDTSVSATVSGTSLVLAMEIVARESAATSQLSREFDEVRVTASFHFQLRGARTGNIYASANRTITAPGPDANSVILLSLDPRDTKDWIGALVAEACQSAPEPRSEWVSDPRIVMRAPPQQQPQDLPSIDNHRRNEPPILPFNPAGRYGSLIF